MEFLIYLDVCCLNRPFDNQVQERVRLESEAVLLILTRCQSHEWQMLGSEAIDTEIAQTPDLERRERAMLLASLAATKVIINEQVESRAPQLVQLGFKVYDALHIACAEAGNADILLTTDDRLVRRAVMHSSMLEVRVQNPILWLLEVTTNGNSPGESDAD